MAGTIVRTARDADVPEIERLVARSSAAHAPADARTHGVDWSVLISAMGAAVATRDDRVVGVLVAWPHPDHVLVDLLAVAVEVRGSGVGTTLLDRAELLAIETGTNTVRAHADTGSTASRYLERHGFAEVAIQQGRSGRVLLEKRLR